MKKVLEVDINREVDYSGCKEGMHPFKVISRNDADGFVNEVVRWCPKCGAIVVDMENDNRVHAGYYKKIQFPEITKKYGYENYIFSKNDEKVSNFLVIYTKNDEEFVFSSEKTDSFSEAIIELMNALGENSEVFMKALNGMTTNEEIVALFDLVSSYKIVKYYKVSEKR